MKIEVGKFMKTRDGRKVRIYAVDGCGNEHVHGAILLDENLWLAEVWDDEGVSGCPGELGASDIVSEWEEPAKVGPSGISGFEFNHLGEILVTQKEKKHPRKGLRLLAYFKPTWWGGPKLVFRREMYGPCPGGMPAKWLDEPEEV